MSTKVKTEQKVAVLKGKEAEDAVLDYVKKMNRPYGAVDVAANLKGAVPKATTQKILVALAEKGELVQKTYGKTTFFVVNQANLDSVPAEKIAALETELKEIDEENKLLAADVRSTTTALAKLKATPTDIELDAQIADITNAVGKLNDRLQPLREGAPPVSPDEKLKLTAEWDKWRAEWFRRRKVFKTFWQLATDALTPQDAEALAENLGIEFDTPEHETLERGLQTGSNALKRKR